MREFPWADYMALGLGTLRLPPAAFWAATPREISAAFAARRAAAPSRAEFERMMQMFPDVT